MIDLPIIFALIFVLSIYFRKSEYSVLGIMLIAYIYIYIYIAQSKLTEAVVLMCYGVAMTMVEISCIYFNMWQYNFATHIVPVWLPVGWALAGKALLYMLDTATGVFAAIRT
jgi:hypothetical protein